MLPFDQQHVIELLQLAQQLLFRFKTSGRYQPISICIFIVKPFIYPSYHLVTETVKLI